VPLTSSSGCSQNRCATSGRGDRAKRFAETHEELAKLLPQDPASQYDLTKLSNDEFDLLERLLAKAAGAHSAEIVPPETPPFRIEFVGLSVPVALSAPAAPTALLAQRPSGRALAAEHRPVAGHRTAAP